MPDRMTRRGFQVKAASTFVLSTATAVSAAHASGSNDRIRLGFIGVANRGSQLMKAFAEHDDCETVALCDVDSQALAKAAGNVPNATFQTGDFRKLIERTDIDAVVIATPDHWHAIQAISACAAGKDVYVEKPLSVTIHEGRAMVNAARKYKRVVQVGTHRRSSPLYAELSNRVQAGLLGKVCVSRAYRLSNMAPAGIGIEPLSSPPQHLDWDMWLGPRDVQPYQANIAPYKFRWWQDYSSQMGNWGVHYLDAIRWCLGEEAPSSVCAMGGRFAVDDDRTIPDTMEVTFQFDSGRLAIFGQYETSGNPMMPSGEIELRGTGGTAYVSERAYEIIPEGHGQFQEKVPRTKPEKQEASYNNHSLTSLHARNFLDCMTSRENPHADIEIGHRSTTFCHLANLSQKLGRRLEWDAKTEHFVADEEANSLLHYEYRSPWTLPS
ncbi:Glycosyl hydrolase [Planctomycetes bacterium CA13]|uniref:Glycosyl hydrolase n=1 Tax=Novipirellula herctigrandis TaxID=2527986 RepID=A0A5C5Z6P7_9BACT|nr:Glycosyl hydrolase [Planctomycetes bacterium CA13]